MKNKDIVCLSRSTVSFWDIVDSVKLYHTYGDQAGERWIRLLLRRFSAIAEANGGKVVKTTGDGMMLDFPTPDQAAKACMEAQRSSSSPVEEGAPKLEVKMGFCEGEVVSRDNDLFGNCVNLASRLGCQIARAGHILTTDEVARSLSLEMQSYLDEFDEAQIKGIAIEVKIVQLLWRPRNVDTRTMVRPSVRRKDLQFSCLDLRYRGASLTLPPEELPVTVGRSPSCTLQVHPSMRSASGTHLKIEHVKGKFQITDQSRNGTYVVPKADPEHPIFVRNETFTLTGQGLLGLGITPVGEMDAIEYSVL